ncbi:MAG TPA: SDR family oxidoreductase [Kofleriaceae bacterium]|nr:SDR family oxidoreductase [Kofleriaceae bacterium]
MNQRTLGIAAAVGALAGARALARRARAYELRDKVVLVTGGSRGLGLVIARELARHGARIAICARDEDELGRAKLDLIERGAHVIAVPCDLTDRTQIARLVTTVRDQLGPIEVLVNNAGVIQVGPMELMTLGDYEQAMHTHFWGPLQLTLAVLPDMRARQAGRIVNITSIGGKIAVPHMLPYTASKFALVGLSEGLREELAKDGIRVTTVVPGLMRTGSPPNALFKGQHRAEYTWFAIGDSLPITSMSADRAARQIIDALVHGDPEVTLSIQAKLATRLHGLVPGAVQRLLGLVNRVLPKPGGIGPASAAGRDSRTPLASSVLTASTERAAARNNEL